ncbi:MAG: flavorubredoxin [Sulfurimonas sp.]|jgi:flavorubredoxin|uniref:MBL fold metallo-hydrolase n=1 Tax=Sulfurimonas sp. TaxID=2022749 RepID=UPI0039E69B37
MSHSYIDSYLGQELTLETITPLYKNEGHEIYWLGIDDETAFRCNAYLIKDNDEYIIVDPGSRSFFAQVQERVSQITDLKNVKGLILCHQDPDVAASMIDWLDFNPEILIISSARTNVLLPHYGRSDYEFYDITEDNSYSFKSGRKLTFVEAPFLHFPGAFTTYDNESSFLFSGDIWAALDITWNLTVSDFEEHKMNMDLFHLDYMASNVAARGYVRQLDGISIEAILPQHGSIIPKGFVLDALEYLKNLRCGVDLVYSDLSV